MLQIPTSFIVVYKYFHANALEHGRNTNSLSDSSRLGGFVLALRMVFFFLLIRFFTIYIQDLGLFFATVVNCFRVIFELEYAWPLSVLKGEVLQRRRP